MSFLVSYTWRTSGYGTSYFVYTNYASRTASAFTELYRTVEWVYENSVSTTLDPMVNWHAHFRNHTHSVQGDTGSPYFMQGLYGVLLHGAIQNCTAGVQNSVSARLDPIVW